MGCCQSKAPVRSTHDTLMIFFDVFAASKPSLTIIFHLLLFSPHFLFLFPVFCRFSHSLFLLSASSSPSHPPSTRERQSGPSTTTTRHKLFLPLMARNQKNQKRSFILGIVTASCQFVTQRQVLHRKKNHQV